jgi:hypothetical protein
MRKLLFSQSLLLLLVTTVFLGGCQKENSIEEKAPPGMKETTLVDEAKQFFQTNVQNLPANGSNSWEKRNKTALWENAYIAKYPKQDLVIVPLQFNEGASISSQVSGDEKLELKKQSKLVLYKDKDNNFKSEVYTYIPDKNYRPGSGTGFSGLVLIDSWAGANIGNYIFKNGKYLPLQKAAGRTEDGDITCYYLNEYECTVDEFGFILNCMQTNSTPLGCYNSNNQYLEWLPPEGTGGVTYYPIEEYDVSRQTPWWDVYTIQITPVDYKVSSFEVLRGKKNANEAPYGGHFTHATHGSSTCSCLYGAYTYYEDNADMTNNGGVASARIYFHYFNSGIRTDRDGVKSWTFQEMFP